MKFLVVRFNAPGFHNWPDPPETYEYLGSKHRHLFHWIIKIEIEEDNRQIEFIDFKEWVLQSIYLHFGRDEVFSRHLNFVGKSCEMIAQETKDIIDREWPKTEMAKSSDAKVYSIEVNEDGENGALIEW